MRVTTYHMECDVCAARASVDHINDTHRPAGWADIGIHLMGDPRGYTFHACPGCLQTGKLSSLVERLQVSKKVGF
jgi:hypothetical protein